MFQSTHPHGVRRSILVPYTTSLCVSIHAPTWGATQARLNPCILYIVSIHAPTWGATPELSCPDTATLFQSTHPHGVRPNVQNRLPHSVGFQSTHPHGVRQTSSHIYPGGLGFQSTHPHGVRQIPSRRIYHKSRCFNPRTHMGCDRPHSI